MNKCLLSAAVFFQITPHTGKLMLWWKKLSSSLPVSVSVMRSCSESSLCSSGQFGGSAQRILRLRVSTTERMPPLRLLIMAHPFPPGSTLHISPLPSGVYHRSHHGGEQERGWIPPFCYAQTLNWHNTHGLQWRRRLRLRHRFHLHWAD